MAEGTVSRRERLEQRVGRVIGGLGLLWYELAEPEPFVGFQLFFSACTLLRYFALRGFGRAITPLGHSRFISARWHCH